MSGLADDTKLWHGTLQNAREKHGVSIIVWYMLATPDRACLSWYFPEGKKDKLAQQGTPSS